jgi:hypothetical protein
MPRTFKSIGKMTASINKLISIVSAGITLMVMSLLLAYITKLIWGGLPGADPNVPAYLQTNTVDPIVRGLMIVIVLAPTTFVYFFVLNKLTKRAVAKLGSMEYPEEVKRFIKNTKRAWNSYVGVRPSGEVGTIALTKLLGNMSSGTIIGSKALRIFFEKCDLYPNEFFVATDEFQNIYILTNKRIMNLYLFTQPPSQIGLDKLVSYEIVNKNFGSKALMIKTSIGNFETEVKVDQLDTAIKMKDWIDQTDIVDDIRNSVIL